MTRWKMIYLARRNPQLSPQAFPQAWREHSALGRQCRNVQGKVLGVRQCSRMLEFPNVPVGASADYDGVNLMQLRDRQVADDIWDDEETRRIMRPDEPRVFSTYVRSFTLTVAETPLRDGAHTGFCVVLFLRGQQAGLLRADRFHTLAGTPWNAARRLVWNDVDGERPAGYAYDAIVEAWFDSLEQVRAVFGNRLVWKTLPGDLIGFIDAQASVCMLTQVTHQRP